jgi:hypothetical protein
LVNEYKSYERNRNRKGKEEKKIKIENGPREPFRPSPA